LDAIARGEGEAEKWLHSFYFGNGQVGLRDLVAEEHLAQIDKAEVNSVHVGVDAEGRKLVVRVWPNGANIERGDEPRPVPAGLGRDEEITAQNGRYGPYLKKGNDSRSLPSEDALFNVTLDEARAIFAQPKQRRGRVAKPPLAELGAHPESGAPVRVLDGRF